MRDDLSRKEEQLRSEMNKVEEREYLLTLHREKEEKLIGEARDLAVTLDRTTAHISSLEEKVSLPLPLPLLLSPSLPLPSPLPLPLLLPLPLPLPLFLSLPLSLSFSLSPSLFLPLSFQDPLLLMYSFSDFSTKRRD